MRAAAVLLLALATLGAAAAVAACFAATASAAPAPTWAGLTRAEAVRLARAGADVYTRAGAGPVATIVMRRYYRGHEAWLIKADFTCAGGHFPTIVVWRSPSPFRPDASSFMCRAARGLHVVCRELSVC